MIELAQGESDRITVVVKEKKTGDVKPLTGFTGNLLIKKYNNSEPIHELNHIVDDSDLANGVLVFFVSKTITNGLVCATYKISIMVDDGTNAKKVFEGDLKITAK